MSWKHNSYTANFKLQVIDFAESLNNSMAARHFTVNKKQIWEWRKRQREIAETPKSKKVDGRRLMFDALEKRLADWIQKSRLNGHIVMRTAVQIRMFNLVKMPEFVVKEPADFAASIGWCNSFMIQHILCVRA